MGQSRVRDVYIDARQTAAAAAVCEIVILGKMTPKGDKHVSHDSLFCPHLNWSQTAQHTSVRLVCCWRDRPARCCSREYEILVAIGLNI